MEEDLGGDTGPGTRSGQGTDWLDYSFPAQGLSVLKGLQSFLLGREGPGKALVKRGLPSRVGHGPNERKRGAFCPDVTHREEGAEHGTEAAESCVTHRTVGQSGPGA